MPIEKATILIVDDIAENIELLAHMLRGTYQVKAATSGPQALKVIENSGKPDMILLDIMMPEMDGYDVIRKLKSDEELKSIPVIFISAKSEVDDETLGLSLGAADYITKPMRPAIVLARIKTHLELYEQKQQLKKQANALQKMVRVLKSKLLQSGLSEDTLPLASDSSACSDQLLISDDHQEKMHDCVVKLNTLVEELIKRNDIDREQLAQIAELLKQYSHVLDVYPLYQKLAKSIAEFTDMIQNNIHSEYRNKQNILEYFESFFFTLDYYHRQMFEKSGQLPVYFYNSLVADMNMIKKAMQ